MRNTDRLLTLALGCAMALMIAVLAANIVSSRIEAAAMVFPH